MKSNILCVGCSHSHTGWGKSWPDFLSTSLNKNLIRASSPGAGNSFFIEKINHAIQHNDIDLVVVQLTEPSRVVTGFSFYENKNYPDFYNDPNKINDLACYTWNVCDNEKNFRSMLNKNTSIDHIWISNVSLSKWTAYKVMQDIALIQYICFKFNIPVVFWSWFVPNFLHFFNPSLAKNHCNSFPRAFKLELSSPWAASWAFSSSFCFLSAAFSTSNTLTFVFSSVTCTCRL